MPRLAQPRSSPLPVPPLSGWRALRILDADQLDPLALREFRCDRCRRVLRWLHVLAHSGWPHNQQVGRCCAYTLCDDGYDAAGAERDAQNLARRRQRFLRPDKWRRNHRGNLVRASFAGWRVTIFSSSYGNGYCFSLAIGRKGKPTFSNPFATEAEAMAGAFTLLARQGN